VAGFCLFHGESGMHQYGKTPLLTIEKVAQYANIGERDCVLELGCGTGCCTSWLTYFTSCRVIAIDKIPHFVDLCNKLI
jgi:precorrin-6B methylase 2